MHKLLARQLRKHFGSPENVPPSVQAFVDAVERAYLQSDDDRAMLEHSMETVSEELGDRFGRLQQALSESQQAKVALKKAVSLLSATLESTADGILVVDRSGRMVQMNRRFRELWRIPDEVVESRNDADALAFVLDQLSDPGAFLRKVRELYDDPAAESVDVLPFKDGRTFERYSLPQRIGDEIVGRVWSFRDVTERSHLEEQLRQSQKLEAVGALAGGVAHDFNNLLTVIRGHVDFIEAALGTEHPSGPDVREIANAAERATALTRQLLAFSRKQVLQPVALDLNEVVATLMSMLRRLIGEQVAIAFEPAAGGAIVTADPTRMEQCIVNLVLNARDAMPAGGQIRISIALAERDALPARERAHGLPGGDFVALRVSDTGHGVAPEHRARIFEPFFSTKDVGKGTGLGLSTVFGIVTQSGGHVTVDSEPGQGATFTLYLPRAESPDPSAPGLASEIPRLDGTETVLVAEDEDGVRSLVQRLLEYRGYTVLTARDAPEAEALHIAHGGAIDLLLSDVVMPGPSGVELAARLRDRTPGLRVLFMSGYAAEQVEQGGGLVEGANLIRKPFTSLALEQAVRSALDVRSSGRLRDS